MSSKRKCPAIYWSQNETDININIDLILDDMHPRIKILKKYISLEAYGFGSADSGPHKYYFELDLFEAVDVEKSEENVNVYGSQMSFVLKKANPSIWWPRLTAQPQKQNWVHIDEENWIVHDLDQQEFRDILTDYPGIDDLVHKEELGYRKDNKKTVYLFFYNLLQFIGFLFIMCVLSINFYRDGYYQLIKVTYQNVGSIMKFFQLLQYLEVMHPLFGYTKGSIMFPFLQVTGRNFILFCMIEAESRIQTKPVILYLFFVWSLIECVRYPYYMLALLKCDIYILTWIRYTIWIPLYPMGVICEGIIVLRNLPYFEETKRFSIVMPNKWNFSFSMCTLMKCHLVFVLPALYVLMKHMARIRNQKLRSIKINYGNQSKKSK